MTGIHLVVEPSVLVLPKQRLPDGRKGADFEQPQPLFERVVDLDFALTAENNHTAGTTHVRNQTVQKEKRGEGEGGKKWKKHTIPPATAHPHPTPPTPPCPQPR